VYSVPEAWVLQVGWDDIAAVKSSVYGLYSEEFSESIAFGSWAWHAFNLTFLVVGIVGWLFLIVGLVVGFLDDDAEGVSG
jgi:hypothetical protein